MSKQEKKERAMQEEAIRKEEAKARHQRKIDSMTDEQKEAFYIRVAEKKKKEHKKNVAMVVTEIVLGVLILVVLLGIVTFGVCTVENVEVEGSSIYSEEELQDKVLTGKYSNNVIFGTISSWFTPNNEIPFINSYKIKMAGLNTIKIVVDERTPFGYCVGEDSKYYYFDEDGNVSDIFDSSINNVTLWKDQKVSATDVGQKITDDEVALSNYLEVAKALKAKDIKAEYISVDKYGKITMGFDKMVVNFGLKKDLDKKIDRLSKLISEKKLDGHSGTLHLENYSSENTDIVLKKS